MTQLKPLPLCGEDKDETLHDLLTFAGVVNIDETDDWLKQWVRYSIVRERVRKAAEHDRQS